MHSEDQKRAHGIEAYLTNRLGHATGRGIAKAMWRKEWVRKMAAQNPELFKLFSEGLVALTSLLELGGDHPLVRMANFVAESVTMENLELLEQFEENPDDPELAKKVEQAMDAAVDSVKKNEVVIAFDHIHKDAKCVPVATLVAMTTPPPRTDKQGKPLPSSSPVHLVRTDMASAVAAGKPLCGICYPALSVRKAEDPQKAKEVVPGKNFMEYLMRLRKEEPREYVKFWDMYLLRLEGPDGPDLARKFQEAFNGKHSYEAFRFVVDRPHRNEDGGEEWHHALDALLGQVTPPDSLRKKIEGFIDEEKRQTKDMFLALFAWIEKANKERSKKIVDKKASIAELDQEWERRKAKPGFWNGTNIVIIFLAVILAAAWMFHRTETPDRSETSEQKVETPNVR
jgi:hypothetical protein